jgi:dihydrofolate reductase
VGIGPRGSEPGSAILQQFENSRVSCNTSLRQYAMTERSSIEGYAIVSTDGMIADRNRQMPDGLKIDADVRHFNDGLDRAALIVHGRHSHEQQAVSDRRRRLVVTRAIPALGRHPSIPNAWQWNPAGLSFAKAREAIGILDGMVAVTGGAQVFGLFLDIGFDAFHLSRAGKVAIPGGRPVFPQVPGQTPEQVLSSYGMVAGPPRALDAQADATLVIWHGPGSLRRR